MRQVLDPLWITIALAGCASSADDRPLEIDYLTQTIFAPACGAAQCHSTFARARGVVLDHPDRVRASLVDRGLVRFDSDHFDPGDPHSAALIIWLTDDLPFGGVPGDSGDPIPRMPFDAPLLDDDVALLEAWIVAGAPGAQCNPDTNRGRACSNRDIVECNPDWSFGATLESCPNDCIQGTCR